MSRDDERELEPEPEIQLYFESNPEPKQDHDGTQHCQSVRPYDAFCPTKGWVTVSSMSLGQLMGDDVPLDSLSRKTRIS